MSDTIKEFIPTDPFYVPLDGEIDAIKRVISTHAKLDIFDSVQFVDAGSNFESVSCPFCHADLMEWWGNAMRAAFSDNKFANLSVTVPCCGKDTSLNDLEYLWPQGFCRTKITYNDCDNIENETALLDTLQSISGCSWRVIIAHY